MLFDLIISLVVITALLVPVVLVLWWALSDLTRKVFGILSTEEILRELTLQGKKELEQERNLFGKPWEPPK